MTVINQIIPEVVPTPILNEIDPRVFGNFSVVPPARLLAPQTINAPALVNANTVRPAIVTTETITDIDAPLISNASSITTATVSVAPADVTLRPGALANSSSITTASVSVATTAILRPPALTNTSSITPAFVGPPNSGDGEVAVAAAVSGIGRALIPATGTASGVATVTGHAAGSVGAASGTASVSATGALAGINLDGHVSGDTGSGSSLSVSLTSTFAGVVIVQIVVPSGASVSSVASTHLTFTQRATHSAGSNQIQVWTAYSSGALSSESITVTTGSTTSITVSAMNFAGVQSTGYLDSNGSLPATAGGTFPNNPVVSGISSTTGSFAVFMLGGDQISLGNPTGFTSVESHSAGSGLDVCSSYHDYGSPLSSVTLSVGTNPYGGFGWNAAVIVLV